MKKNQKASALATSLVILGIVLMIAIGISTVSVQERRISIGTSRSSQAYQNADTGIEKVLYQMLKIRLSTDSVATISVPGDFGCDASSGLIKDIGGKFNLELKDSDGNRIACNSSALISSISSVKSTGISADENRAIEMAVAASCNNATPIQASIANDTIYQNTTTHKLIVIAFSNATLGASLFGAIGSSNPPSQEVAYETSQGTANRMSISFIVPANYFYKVYNGGTLMSAQAWEVCGN